MLSSPVAIIVACLASYVVAVPTLKARTQNCQAIAHAQISNTGGGPGQAPFTDIISGLTVTREGNTVYSNQDNTIAHHYEKQLSASEWGGQDPIKFDSDFEASSVSYQDCSLTDTNSGQYYTGTPQSHFDEGTVVVTYSTCTVNFLC